MERVGFRFHSKTRKRYWSGFLSAIFVFFMFLLPAIANYRAGKMTQGTVYVLIPTFLVVGLAAGLLAHMLYRSYREKFILEFTETEIIDRRYLKLTRIPYSDIEIFSPPMDQIFRPNPALREIQNELEIGEFLIVTCRLKENAKAKGPAIKCGSFFFSDPIAPTDLSDTALELAIRSRLKSQSMTFETLYEIDESEEG